MNIGSITAAFPGGSAALRSALRSPMVQAAAQKAGVNLADPVRVNELLGRVNALMPPQTRAASASSAVAVRVADYPQRPVQNYYTRQALKLYADVAALE
jgi:hypothetical protein